MKIGWLETPDGARQAAWSNNTFFDSQTQDYCSVLKWSDGMRRCVPSAPSVVYDNPGCSGTPLGLETGTGPWVPAPFYRKSPAGPIEAMYTPAAAVTPQGQSYWQYFNNTCNGPFQLGHLPNSDQRLWTLTPTADFVVVEDVVEPGPGPLKRIWTVGADGLQELPQTEVVYDAALDAPCRPEKSTGMCVPSSVGWAANLYDDEACTVPVYERPAFDTTSTMWRTCAGPELYAAGATTTGIFKLADGTCSAYFPDTHGDPPPTYGALGTQVGTLKSYGTTVVADANHRLRHVAYTGNGLDDLMSSRMYDAQLDVECYLTTQGCLPVAGYPTKTVYTNGCTTPLLGVVDDRALFPGPCGSTFPSFTGMVVSPDDVNFYRVTTVRSTTNDLSVKLGTDCLPWYQYYGTNVKFWELQPAFDRTQLETATFSLDP